MSSNIQRFVRFFDLSRAQVSLKVNRQDSFSTFTGGLCSLVMILVILTVASFELLRVFQNPQIFKERLLTTYLDVSSETVVFTMPRDDFIPAIQIIDQSALVTNITQYVIPYFAMITQIADPVTGAITSKTDLYKTKPCSDIYDDKKLMGQFQPYKETSYGWYCPDLKEIKVQNDPRADPNGIASFFIINYCDFAAQSLGYNDPNCEVNHSTIDQLTTTMLVNTKIVSRYFNPNLYLENQQTLAYAQVVQKTGIFTHTNGRISQMDFKVHQTTNQLKSSKFLENRTSPENIVTYRADYQQTSFLLTGSFESDGIFQVYFSQDPQMTSRYYISEYTLLAVFAWVGGSLSFYYCLVYFLTAGYTKFKFESELAGRLYTERTQTQQSEDSVDKDEMQAAILNRKQLRKLGYFRYLLDSVIIGFCCCCKESQFYKGSLANKRRNTILKHKLNKETDLVYVVKQLRILQLISTTLLRRNQSELVAYSAQYNLALQDHETLKRKETANGEFPYISESVRTLPQLLKGFEPRVDIYDRALLFLLTGREKDECMQSWREADDGSLFTFGDSEQDDDTAINQSKFEKYLVQEVDQDFDLALFDEEQLGKILLLPNGRKLSLANESLLTGSVDFKQMRSLTNKSSLYQSQPSLARMLSQQTTTRSRHIRKHQLSIQSDSSPTLLSNIIDESEP